jgi:hypothetical protein
VIGGIEPGTRVRLTLQDEDSDIWDFAQAGLIGVNDLA